ncbi:hypothetical protein E2C01_098774 [Portunus trituberculatus]|uniref:Uncharacterized protein n=1 Tax=Portunus trituberculatus TaxID=210409 RepID=A0A5B7K7T7_PORTR|nr:hypothetical protein [Portunus trituberculatus]
MTNLAGPGALRDLTIQSHTTQPPKHSLRHHIDLPSTCPLLDPVRCVPPSRIPGAIASLETRRHQGTVDIFIVWTEVQIAFVYRVR